MMWYEEISEGAHVGTTTHQGTPGGLSAPRWVVPSWCTSLWYYLHQKFINNQKKSYHIFTTFRDLLFLGHFLLHMKFRKQTKHGILFYLTNKNKKQKVGTEGSAY